MLDQTTIEKDINETIDNAKMVLESIESGRIDGVESKLLDDVDVSPSIPADNKVDYSASTALDNSDDTGNSGNDNDAGGKYNGSDESVISNYSIESNITVSKQKAEVDDEKIQAAVDFIVWTFGRKLSELMLVIGEYLIKNFYGGNYELAKGKRFTKDKSLNKLIQKIKEESAGNSPSSTWLYDAVNYAIDNHLYTQGEIPSVYGELRHSVKVNITYCPNDSKTKLIEEAADKNMTVVQLRERIKELKNTDGSPDNISIDEKLSFNQLNKLDLKKLNKLLKKLEEKEKNYRKQLKTYEGNLAELKAAINKASAENDSDAEGSRPESKKTSSNPKK